MMLHLRDEGWKETKVMSVSAVPTGRAARAQRVEKHSYRQTAGVAGRFCPPHLFKEKSYSDKRLNGRRPLSNRLALICRKIGACTMPLIV